MRQWDAALIDAEEVLSFRVLSNIYLLTGSKSIQVQSSVIGYIAKCVTLVGKGDTHAGRRVCDIASLLFHPDYVGILLLIKVGFRTTPPYIV